MCKLLILNLAFSMSHCGYAPALQPPSIHCVAPGNPPQRETTKTTPPLNAAYILSIASSGTVVAGQSDNRVLERWHVS